MRRIVLISLTLLAMMLAACAQNFVWRHPTKGSYSYDKDASLCDIEAQRARSQVAREMKGSDYAEVTMENAYDTTFDGCMQRKGWHKVKE
jgi:hypothetical protein